MFQKSGSCNQVARKRAKELGNDLSRALIFLKLWSCLELVTLCGFVCFLLGNRLFREFTWNLFETVYFIKFEDLKTQKKDKSKKFVLADFCDCIQQVTVRHAIVDACICQSSVCFLWFLNLADTFS